jgi:hypothetical protein
MKKTHLPVFLAVFLVLVATSASAQNYQNFQDDWTRIKAAPLSFGPFRIFPGFQLKNFGFDNNIYFENQPLRDFTATLSPEATVYLPLRNNAILYFRDNPEYHYYVKEKRQRAFTNSYFTGAKLRFFQRIVLWGDYSYGEYKQPVSVELARPIRDVQEAVALGLFFETARKTALGVSWRNVRYSYRDIQLAGDVIGLSHVLNRRERTIAMEFYYQAWPGTFVFTNAGYSEYRFDQAALERDSQAAQLGVGVRFPILGKIRGTFLLGYRKLIPRDRGKPGFAGLYGESELSYRTGKFGFRIGFGRGDSFSYLETAYLFLGTRLLAGLSYYLTRVLRVDYSVEFGTADYPGRTSFTAEDGNIFVIQRRDLQIWQSAGVVLRVFKNTGLGISFNSSRWTSNLPGWDRRRDFVGAYLTTQF